MEDKFFKICKKYLIDEKKEYMRVNMQSLAFQKEIKEAGLNDVCYIDNLLADGRLVEIAGTYCIHPDYWPVNSLDIDIDKDVKTTS